MAESGKTVNKIGIRRVILGSTSDWVVRASVVPKELLSHQGMVMLGEEKQDRTTIS